MQSATHNGYCADDDSPVQRLYNGSERLVNVLNRTAVSDSIIVMYAQPFRRMFCFVIIYIGFMPICRSGTCTRKNELCGFKLTGTDIK